jgi:hypothetical protein
MKGTTVKLTPAETKMAIEYFSAQAAEDAPLVGTDWAEWDKHIWMTCYEASLKIERKINEAFWAQLILAHMEAQQFDRDPAAYLFERGDDDNETNRAYYHDVMKDLVSSSIDQTFQMSKAA